MLSKVLPSRQRHLAGILSFVAICVGASVPATPANAQTASLVHDFNTFADGTEPHSRMVQTPDGTFFGTTTAGGAYNGGTIFKITPAGQYVTLYQLGGIPTYGHPDHGSAPRGNLLIGPDGNIYGTMCGGGAYSEGTVFKLTPDGVLSTLYDFTYKAYDGENPVAGLTYDPADGKFYGVTHDGGANSRGTVFSLTLDGVETVIKSLDDTAAYPESALCYNPADDMLYGTASYANNLANGAIFKISTNGVLTIVQNLDGTAGYNTLSNGMVLASDGNLYGTLASGGTNGAGTIYKIASGVFSTVYNFSPSVGKYPDATMISGSDGALYGTSQTGGSFGAGSIFKMMLGDAPAFTVLHNFTARDGMSPDTLMQSSTGLLYGVAQGGDRNYGIVFNVTMTGSFFIVKDFNTGFHDGIVPNGSLLFGRDGNWYGTTGWGGLYDSGTIFRIAADGSYNILYNFGSNYGSIGNNPLGGLTQAPDGAFYGVTPTFASSSYGSVYKVTISGSPEVVTVTTVCTLPGEPTTGLLLGSDGNLYGTTRYGGTYHYGCVFKVDPVGALTLLHSFTGADGEFPEGSLVQCADGGIYGQADDVIYKITTNGDLLWTRHLTIGLGYAVRGGLSLGADGNVYAITNQGGVKDSGDILKITPDGAVSATYNFPFGPFDAWAPFTLGPDNKLYACNYFGVLMGFAGISVAYSGNLPANLGTTVNQALAYGPDGYFYGATTQGGANHGGTLFKYDLGFPGISSFSPAAAVIGSAISITGKDLTKANAVSINGAPAAFSVVDDNHINAIVPSHAAVSGSITVSASKITAKRGTFVVVPPTAIHVIVTAPSAATAGTALYVTVAARDQVGNVVKDYTGAIHFTSTDTQAVLPADVILTGGTRQFSVKLRTPGAQTITATDTVNGSLTATTGSIMVSTVLSKFAVSAPTLATAGSAFWVTVTAKDSVGNTVTGYSGTVHLISTDGQAILPADVPLTNGVGTFAVTLRTAASQSITVADTVTSAVKGAMSGIVVASAPASQLLISAPATATHNVLVNPVVTAKDAYGNIAKGYTGTLRITSTDPLAVLPGNLTMPTGTRSVGMRFKTLGSQTFTATDTVNSALTATSTMVTVN